MNGRPQYPVPPPPARLSLAPAEALEPHRVDGAWWPRTRDLHRELLPLLRGLEPRWGDVTRVTVHADMWRPCHRSMQLTDRLVHIFFAERPESRHIICLLSHTGGRCDLLVVPPPTSPAEAERLMAAAGRPQGSAATAQSGPDASRPPSGVAGADPSAPPGRTARPGHPGPGDIGRPRYADRGAYPERLLHPDMRQEQAHPAWPERRGRTDRPDPFGPY